MYTPKSKLFKVNPQILEALLRQNEIALAMLQIGVTTKVLTNMRLISLGAFDSGVKEFIPLSEIQEFDFDSTSRTPKLNVIKKDGTTINFGSINKDWVSDVEPIFKGALENIEELPETESALEYRKNLDNAAADNYRTNRITEFPKWLKKSILNHKTQNEDLLMVITEPRVSHQGALLVFNDRCMIVKGGLAGGLMAGSLGGERASTFYFTQITGIEYNSGFINGVLEVLTASYNGTANKDFWRGTNKSRNSDSNDPWTLSNCLPLSKEGFATAKLLIDDLKQMIAQSHQTTVQVTTHSTPQASMADELTKLVALRDSGVLSEEEFAEAKAKILKS